MTHQIVINSDGSIEFIYSDELRDLVEEGVSTITRISNVEPEGTKWVATMLDGVRLGPFNLRQQALNAEIEYLNKEML